MTNKKVIALNFLQKLIIINLLAIIFSPLNSYAQAISFSSFRMLQKASLSEVNNYFVTNGWTLKGAEDSKNDKMKYVIFSKGDESSGAFIKLAFDKDDIREMYRGNIIRYGTANKVVFDKIKSEVKASDWKSDEPIIKNGEFLSCYTDGNNAILLGPVTRDDITFYTITMVSWIEYNCGEQYLGRAIPR